MAYRHIKLGTEYMTIKLFDLSAVKPSPKEFTRKMISDLAEFQNYGGSGKFKKLGDSLLSHPWPARFTKPPAANVYRIMCLPKVTFDSIMSGTKYAVSHASSWTLSEKIAREFMGSYWFDDYASNLREKNKDPVAFILAMKPKGKVLDINALHKDKAFVAAKESFDDSGVSFNEGLEFGSSQQEIAVPSYVIAKALVIDYATLTMKKWNSGKKFSG
jgi:hypothetical protein